MAGANNFAIQKEHAQEAVEWLNTQAKQKNQKFKAELKGYTLSSIRFGNFEVISWKGDWSAARNLIVKASEKLKIKVIEAGYSERNILLSLIGQGREFGKVYSNGIFIGHVELASKGSKWIIKSEKPG